MDKKYWKKFYKKKQAPNNQSKFADFVFKNFMKPKDTLIELGCGNGRDSLFFASKKINVTAIDQCENEIDTLKNKILVKNIKFICTDFTRMSNKSKFKHIYSRFTIHSISEKEEDGVITWAYRNLKKNGYFLIEARGKKNELYKLGKKVDGEKNSYIYENHYRRFIDINELSEKLTNAGFDIVYKKEKKDFAPFKDTNYKFLRIIAKKI